MTKRLYQQLVLDNPFRNTLPQLHGNNRNHQEGSGLGQSSGTHSLENDKGWFLLLQALITEVRDLRIRIYEIDTSHGELDVRFISYAEENVSAAWENAMEMRLYSRSVCSKCGGYGLGLVFNPKRLPLCKYCERGLPKEGETGTWLDQY